MPCVQYGVLAEHMGAEMQPLGTFWTGAGAFLILDLAAGCVAPMLWPGISLLPASALLHFKLRSKMRAKYGIQVRDLHLQVAP
jgi:hypothetical protein